MHGNAMERRALEREALRNVINQWNANRLDLFELSEPNEDLEFHGVMRFYFQDSGQKVATKCIRVASDATVEDVIGTLVEKFRPDMRMLSVPSYALYELHEACPERKMSPDEKPLLVQLNWHVDDREGRFLLKNVDDKTVHSLGSMESNASFRRKLSKREKKQLKKQEKLSRMKSDNPEITDKDGVAEKLYTELPETSFTRSISNPEAVMRRRRQQKLEKKLQEFRSKDGRPDTGGTLKIYGEALCKDVPYKTLLLSIRDCAGAVVREMLDKYGLHRADPSQWCLVQVTTTPSGGNEPEYVLDDDECPLSILMNANHSGSIMFHVRRRPADCAPRKRKKKPGLIGSNSTNPRDARGGDSAPLLIELGPDGSAPHPGDTSRTIRLTNEVMEVGSANGIALQLYGPHIQPRHCVIHNTDGVTSLTPCHADAHTYVNGQRIHQTTQLVHGSLIKFGHSNTYRFLDPTAIDDRTRHNNALQSENAHNYDSRSPQGQSPTEPSNNLVETTFDLEGNVETISTTSGNRQEDSRSIGSTSENRLSGMDRFPRGQDPILPAVLEFPEKPQEQFLARVITHLDVTTPTFRLAPAYTLYLCARYRASTHYSPELTPTERAHKLTLLLQHAATLIRHTVQDRSTENTTQAFWLANASELLHFLKSDRHVYAFSIQAQDTLADTVQMAFRNLVACLTDELNSSMGYLLSQGGDEHPRETINTLSSAMGMIRMCRVNAALTIQLFSQLFHWISAKALSSIISNPNLCNRAFGYKLYNRLKNLQAWAESQGLELAADCHLAKILQCVQLLQAPKASLEDLATLSSTCFKLNSMQIGALLRQYKAEPGEKLAPPSLLEQATKAAESVADELARAEGREVVLYEDPAPRLQLLLPDDGFSCDVVQGVPAGLADFLHPLQASGLCRLAAQPTSSGHWTVYMNAPRPPSALSTTQPEVQVIRLQKTGGGMGLSIVAAKGAGQERLGIYIKSVVPSGAADRDGRLAAGDQLLTVDGQSLLGITQEKAAEFLVRTGSVVTLEVAKGGAVYHGLATLLQQPSPQPHRGPRRMSERELPSRIDPHPAHIPASKSVPALNHISPNSEQAAIRPAQHDVFNPGYSRASSSSSINAATSSGVRSRSTHNLHQQQPLDNGGFYQNLSIYKNKQGSPQQQQQLGDRTSVLRSSQNSLHSSIANQPTQNPQRPSSAYYPSIPNVVNARPNLHQSIPNLKSPPSLHRLQNDIDNRSGSYPIINQQQAQHYQYTPAVQGMYTSPPNGYYATSQPQGQQGRPEDLRFSQQGQNSYPSPTHSVQSSNYPIGQPLHIQANNGDRYQGQMPNGSGLLREDVLRHSHGPPGQFNSEMRTSKSDDVLKNHLMSPQSEMQRYASSGNIQNLQRQAKLAEMSEEVRRRQNRPPQSQFNQPGQYNHPNNLQMSSNNLQMQHNLQMQSNMSQNNLQMSQNALSLQNLALSPQQYSGLKSPPIAPKPMRKPEEHTPPEPPPTSTHPLFSVSSQDPPKMAFYPSTSGTHGKTPRDPWAREEQERQAEARREAGRQWQEQQIRELQSIPYRNNQQEEQLRVLQLEREFQRRALEAEQDEEENDKESLPLPQPVSSQTIITTTPMTTVSSKADISAPTSILKPGGNSMPPQQHSMPPQHTMTQNMQPSPPEAPASVPPPPERGSSFAVMSMRQKESTKRVSFNDVSPTQPTTPSTLCFEETIREDPNSFIRQAESMLASPTTPTDASPGILNTTPGVIGAQEVYRDPRTRRLAEQAQQKNLTTPVPEKLSFKEKMKMFAMETGEQGTPKDKSKISRAQREIDGLGQQQNSSMVH